MKVAIAGPGAMGCLFACYLESAGNEVVILDHRPDRARRLAERGIGVSGVRGRFHSRPAVTTDASHNAPYDVLMLWVKAYDTEAAIDRHSAAVGPSTVIFTAQNGLGNVEAIRRRLGSNPIVAGITTEGAYLEAEGEVVHAGSGKTVLGAANEAAAGWTGQLASTLSGAGFACELSSDIRVEIWRKLAVNACINPLTAVLGVPNGKLLDLPGFAELARAVLGEISRAADALGVELDAGELERLVFEVARATAGNRSSMLQDVEAGRRSEIGQINGAVASLVEAPVNDALVRLVEARRQQLATDGTAEE